MRLSDRDLDAIEGYIRHDMDEECCDHSAMEPEGCWDCRNTGHTHPPYAEESVRTALLDLIETVREARRYEGMVDAEHTEMGFQLEALKAELAHEKASKLEALHGWEMCRSEANLEIEQLLEASHRLSAEIDCLRYDDRVYKRLYQDAVAELNRVRALADLWDDVDPHPWGAALGEYSGMSIGGSIRAALDTEETDE